MKKLLTLIESRAVLEKKIANLNTDIASHRKAQSKIEDKLAQLEKEIRESQKVVATLELEIKVLANREKELKQKLIGLVRQKDVDAIRREILTTQDNREQIETSLLEELEKISVFKKNLVNEKPLLLEQEKEIIQKIMILEGFIAEADQELLPLLREVDEASNALPDNMKVQYKRIASRLDRPVVQLTSNCCAACYGFISAQQLSDLKKKQIADCKNCGRILFVDKRVI